MLQYTSMYTKWPETSVWYDIGWLYLCCIHVLSCLVFVSGLFFSGPEIFSPLKTVKYGRSFLILNYHCQLQECTIDNRKSFNSVWYDIGWLYLCCIHVLSSLVFVSGLFFSGLEIFSPLKTVKYGRSFLILNYHCQLQECTIDNRKSFNSVWYDIGWLYLCCIHVSSCLFFVSGLFFSGPEIFSPSKTVKYGRSFLILNYHCQLQECTIDNRKPFNSVWYDIGWLYLCCICNMRMLHFRSNP